MFLPFFFFFRRPQKCINRNRLSSQRHKINVYKHGRSSVHRSIRSLRLKEICHISKQTMTFAGSLELGSFWSALRRVGWHSIGILWKTFASFRRSVERKMRTVSFLWGRDLYPINRSSFTDRSPDCFLPFLNFTTRSNIFSRARESSRSAKGNRLRGEGDPLCRLRDRNTKIVEERQRRRFAGFFPRRMGRQIRRR